MKLTLFIGDMGRGGAERVASILVNNLINDYDDIEIGCLFGIKETGYRIDDRVKMINLASPFQNYLKSTFIWINKIRRYVKKRNPDIIVSFVGRINFLVLVSCFHLHKKIIVSERNDPKHDNRTYFERQLCKFSYRFANKVVFQSKYQMKCFPKKVQSKGVIIKNPIEICSSRKPITKYKIVNVARTAKQKNQKALIIAISKIIQDYPNTILEIYGNKGNCYNELTKLVKEIDASDYIFFKGSVQNVHEQIADSHIFVLFSNYEGMPNALAEAMLLGIPCISTNCSGIDEIIEDGKNGFLVDVNSTDQLIEKIKYIFENENKMDTIIENAIYSIEKNCNVEQIVNQWKKILL